MPLYGSHRIDYSALGIGQRIRDERQRRQLTLKELESRTSISAGRLSQIENDLHVLDVHQAFVIAEALGLERQALLPRDISIPFQITRDKETRSKSPHPIRMRTLEAGDVQEHHSQFWPLADLFVGRHLEPMLASIHPASSGRFYFHDDQEFFFVLSGAVEFSIKTLGRVHQEKVHVGDCVYFNSSLPHFLRAVGSGPAQTIHVLAGSSAEVGAWAGPLATRQVYAEEAIESDDSVSRLMGRRVRILREALRLTPGQVSKVIGVTESHLLQVENGRRTLGLDSLIELARAFGKPLREFTGEASETGPGYFVQRRSDVSKLPRRDRRHPDGFNRVYLPLAEGFSSRHMHPYLVKIQNSPHKSVSPREHHGQEFIYVLEGQVELTTTVEGEIVTERLAPGDACYLDCSVPHAMRGYTRNPYSETSAEIVDVFWCPLGEDYLFKSTRLFDEIEQQPAL